MEQRTCKFVQRKNLLQTSFHPLHLRTDKVKWMSAFGRFDTPCIVCLSHEKNAHHSTETKLFVVLHLDHHPEIYPDSLNHVGVDRPIKDVDKEEIVLISSLEFHQHYGIDKTTTTMVVGSIFTFPLSRIILSANTEETFSWANGNTFERGLMILGTCHKNLLVRQGDQFLAPPEKTFGEDQSATLHHFQNLTALECYPVKQGFVHAGTEVIITGNLLKKFIQPKENKFLGKTGLRLIPNDFKKSISFSQAKFDPQCDVLCSDNTAKKFNFKDGDFICMKLSFQHERTATQDFSSLQIEDSSHELSENEEEYFSIDMPRIISNEEIQPTSASTILKLRIENRHPGNFFCADNIFRLEENHFYISPILWFNISHEGKFKKKCEDVRVEDLSESEEPIFAKEIHLALVLSPTYSPSAQFDNTLMKYLSKTMILKKNDIIVVKTEENPYFLSECEVKDARCQALYYKVMKFGEQEEKSSRSHFSVNLKQTSLYQVGATNSFVPNIISTNYKEPAGLSNYIDLFMNVLRPYIAQEMDNSTGTVLVSGSPGCGKWSVVSSVAKQLNLHIIKISCYELMADSSGATDAKINTSIQRATVYAPCIVVLTDIECIGRDSETGQADHRVCASLQNAIENLQSEELPIAIVAITSNLTGVVSKIKSFFVHQLEVKSLSEIERQLTLQQLVTLTPSGYDIDIQWIAKHTVGFTYGELWELLRQAIENARERITNECAVGSRLSWIDEMSICASGITNQHCDFILALQKMQSQRADIIGVPKIPDVKWEDIGGLEEVKNTIKDTIQLPLDHPELVASGLRRSGILLYGPPGTGKTLLAKAVATQCSLSFLSVKGPELINMYVGQSEENVRKVFSRARDAAPCVVFFDELDSLAPNRGRSGDSGGVMDRVVSQLLAELDGLVEADAEKQIFVIGASNRPDLIDPALLRPGRFDKLLYVGINKDKNDQLKILQAQTRRANLSPDVHLHEIIQVCPENMTGADFYSLTSEAMMNAIRRRIEIEEENEKSCNQYVKEDTTEPLVVEQTDFINAAKNINPSVSKEELLRFQEITEQLSSQ